VAGVSEWLKLYEGTGLLHYKWTIALTYKRKTCRLAGGGGGAVIQSVWVPILVFTRTKGVLHSEQIFDDVYYCPEADKSLHEWQQALEPLVTLISSLCPINGLVADLTVGSGTTPHAVVLAGRGRRFTGCEVVPGHVKIARDRVAAALKKTSSA
jgi:hypothetical protein